MTYMPDLQDLLESNTERERLQASCQTASNYPKNLVYHDTYDHVLQEYFDRLDEQEDRLFFDESNSSLAVRDFDGGVKCFENINLSAYTELNEYINGASPLSHQDPPCRLIFVFAPHSRERLKTTREMLMLAFTYHQVMYSFLDFLFPFGRQQYAQDFHFSGFRQESRISPYERGLNIPELGRSGHDIRICYSLKSVEPSKSQPEWPWSLRQAAIYNSFDLETGKVFWTIVKGDQLLKKRIEEATHGKGARRTSSFETAAESFSSCLEIHLIVFDWCRQHWRWYINYLEAALEKRTRDTLLIDFGEAPTPKPLTKTRKGSLSNGKPNFPRITPGGKILFQNSTPLSAAPPRLLISKSGESKDDESDDDSDDGNSFSLNDLQRVQFLEDKVNEVLLEVQANIDVLLEIQSYFVDVTASQHWPKELLDSSKGMATMAKFNRTSSGVISDLRLQHARASMVLRLLSDRKSLLTGIMDFRNREANKLFAQKAQLSAERMEGMTQNMQDLNQEMHEIAKQTKKETVSMRIITLVTLFFLPGTFISTIMSTDILQYNFTEGGSQEIFQLEALHRYLEITLPLMLATFISWYGVYWWVNRQERVLKSRKSKLLNTA